MRVSGGTRSLELERLAVSGDQDARDRAAEVVAAEEAVIHRLQMHCDYDRHPARHLTNVVDAHDEQASFDELGAARVDDRYPRPVSLDRLRDSFVPDRVARDVHIVEEEAADRSQLLCDCS
jgi:hypothetical protein